MLVAEDCVGLAPQGLAVDGIEHSESTGDACTGRNSGDVHAVCVGGDPVANAGDSDAWSDDDVIGSAAMRGPDWEGGAAGELRGAFSGGRRITSAARDVVTPPPEVATRQPDGNAAPGTFISRINIETQLLVSGIYYTTYSVLICTRHHDGLCV